MNRLFFIRAISVLCCTLPLSFIAFAQFQSNQLIQVVVSPDKPDWTYELGEDVKFAVTVLRHHLPLENAEVAYTIGLEKMVPVQSGKITLRTGAGAVGETLRLHEPGFVRCEVRVKVDGEEYRGIATAAFAPESIQPTQQLPADFWDFWNDAKAKAAKIPMDVELMLLPERCTENVDVYQVGIQSVEIGSRIYGILSRPKSAGKYPALLQLPGAGVRPYPGVVDLAEKGIITLQIGIHGIPVIYEKGIYDDLRGTALKNYQLFGLDDRDNYYFKRVYLGCVRAIDYLFSLPEFDGSTLAVFGSSQGGGLSIVTAALDDRVKYLVSRYPGLCDITGYQHGRAGGWPYLSGEIAAKDAKLKTSAYYDVVNFAPAVKVPGFYTWGYNDEVCPPTTYYAAYNMIQAPKELYLVQETGHWTFPEQRARVREWLLEHLAN